MVFIKTRFIFRRVDKTAKNVPHMKTVLSVKELMTPLTLCIGIGTEITGFVVLRAFSGARGMETQFALSLTRLKIKSITT